MYLPYYNQIKVNSNYNYNYNYNNIPFKMKKSEFNSIDRKVVEDTRVDVGPFRDITDFNDYCNGLTDKITNKNYGGRREETKIQRQSMLQEWFDYVLKENDAYTPSIAYMILNGITKNLKPNEETLPPVLNKGILAQTVEEAQHKVDNEKNLQFNFEKMYKLNLQKNYLSTDKEKTLDENLNCWIIIPSKEQDPKNFDKNVEKLKLFSHDNWCTKTYNARPYLNDGEFHVYMENGKPRLGVRFVGDKIQEIQGPKNNSIIPLNYSDIVTEHIEKYNLSLKAKEEVKQLNKLKKELEIYKKENFPNGIENATTQEILEASGITCEKDKDGLLVISHYEGKPTDDFTYEDLGINENKLFKSIKEIKGNADFRYSKVESLGNLESIEGGADFSNSKITSLGNLKTIGGDADFRYSKVESLGNLESIGGGADFSDSEITSLGNLKSIGGDAYFRDSKVKSLGNLESIGGYAYFKYSEVTDLGNLESIGGDADFRDSEITSLGNLKSIGGDADFSYSEITSLGNLKSIGGYADFSYSEITSLGNLKSIGGYADFRDSIFTSLGNLKSIGKNAYFGDSQVTDLGNLESIGGDVYIHNSKLLEPSDFAHIDVRGNIRN